MHNYMHAYTCVYIQQNKRYCSKLTSVGHAHSEEHVQDPWMCGYPKDIRYNKIQLSIPNT